MMALKGSSLIKKKIKMGIPFTDPNLRADDNRSTWWSAKPDENFKFNRWIKN